ncbi:hypothetical protein PINS_up000706 [Pythium insidiosum]|nr:hypothetical protein PINS_up000706 [Pythium insidiosum]
MPSLHVNTLAGSLGMDDRGIFIVAELRRLLHNSKSPEASKCKNFVKHFECRSISSLRQLRDLHASVTESIIRVHGQRILDLAEERAPENADPEPISVDQLRAITSRHVEEVLFTPVEENIQDFFQRVYSEDDPVLNRKLRWLQGKDQTYYNIPLHQISWKEWRKSSKLLSQVGAVGLPTAKYEILHATINEIRATYVEEHSDHPDSEPFDTDDLIPIFTYVLANSGLDNLLSLKLLLTELNGAWVVAKNVDDGTALSILKYAIEFISNVSIPAVLEDIFRDQITLSIDGDWKNILELEVEGTYRYGAMIRQVLQHGYNTFGTMVTRGFVLVTVNGQNVVLWPYGDILELLKSSVSPHRLAFIPAVSYFKILTANKALWNVALVHACQRGDISSVQMLLANGADVNYVAHECGGNTPLHIATSALHFNVVSYVLQHGAKPKAIGECGRSALHMVGSPCASASPVTSTSTSIIHGDSLRQSSIQKFRPADKVVMIIKKLINHGTPSDSSDIYGNTPLMLLAEKGCVNGIDVLVESNSTLDLNARNWFRGMSALAFAAREGHVDVVEALLDYGVDPETADLQGDTPLHLAAAIASKEICRALIDRGCPVDARNHQGITPLMVAVSRGHDFTEHSSLSGLTGTRRPRPPTHVDNASVLETINLLLSAGADINAVCRLYRLPLHYAAMYGGREVYEFVLSKMPPSSGPQIRDIYGTTALTMLEIHESTSCRGSEDSRSDDPTKENGEDDENVHSDIQRYLTCKSGESDQGGDLVMADREGVSEIVAGTTDAIVKTVFQCDDYKIDDAAALVWTSDAESFCSTIDFLKELAHASSGSESEAAVRRMILHAVDMMVQCFTQKVQLDDLVCTHLYDLCSVVYPLEECQDPQCQEWLSSSVIPTFAEAVRSKRLFDLQMPGPSDHAYSSLRSFLRGIRQTNSNLHFLDDDRFASTFGLEVISEAMRRRLSIAGVWNGDASRSFIIQRESNGDASSTQADRNTMPVMTLSTEKFSSSERSGRWLVEVDVSVIAHQLTVFQHYLFSQVKVSEILESKRSAEKTPAYDRIRQLHNHISMWVVNQVLSRDDVDERALVLGHFIKVAGVCLSPLQNFDGFMAIMNATNDSSVFRLKKTWGRLSPEARDQWHELKKYTENGARALNKLMKDVRPPVIPYLGLVIQNVIAIQEYPDVVEGGLINFKKTRVLGEVVKRVLANRSSPYLLPIDKRVLQILCSSLQFANADACFHRSLKIEPRVATATSAP